MRAQWFGVMSGGFCLLDFVHAVDCSISLAFLLETHKAKAAAASSVAVLYDNLRLVSITGAFCTPSHAPRTDVRLPQRHRTLRI